MGILIGIIVLAFILGAVWLVKHPGSLPAPLTVQQIVAAMPASLEDRLSRMEETFTHALSQVPALVSQQVTDLTALLDAERQRADQAEADLAAEKAAQAGRLNAVRDQIAGVVAQNLPAAAAAGEPPQ